MEKYLYDSGGEAIVLGIAKPRLGTIPRIIALYVNGLLSLSLLSLCVDMEYIKSMDKIYVNGLLLIVVIAIVFIGDILIKAMYKFYSYLTYGTVSMNKKALKIEAPFYTKYIPIGNIELSKIDTTSEFDIDCYTNCIQMVSTLDLGIIVYKVEFYLKEDYDISKIKN